MTKLHISYRNAKGHMKSADPFNCPDDAPEAVKIAAAAVVAAFTYGPPVPVEGTVAEAGEASHAQTMETPCAVKGKRGWPKGRPRSEETKQRMREAKIAMWNRIKAGMSELYPE